MVWLGLSINLDLDNVTLEMEKIEENESKKTKTPLACVNFIKSRLSFDSYSDKSRDVDLVSQEILISDTRFESKILIFLVELLYC